VFWRNAASGRASGHNVVRRGAGAVERGGLENRWPERAREFESHPRRCQLRTATAGRPVVGTTESAFGSPQLARSAARSTSPGSGPRPCRHRSRSRSVSTPRLETNSSGASGEGWSAANARTQLRQCAEQKEPVDLPWRSLPAIVSSRSSSSSARQKEQWSFATLRGVSTARSTGGCIHESASVTMVPLPRGFAQPDR
jgi:hypothetical protein